MAIITDKAAASRLARAILADVALYHHDEIRQASSVLNSAVEEGRVLFRQRTDPSLHAVFEEALMESALAAWGEPVGMAVRSQAPPIAPVERPTPWNLPLIALALAIAAAAAYYVGFRR